MITFSKDVEILKFEPVLFGDLYFSWQVLSGGVDGQLSGTSFSAAGADFVSSGVEAGGVIYLKAADGSLNGAYEIVSVESASSLTVSVVRAEATGDALSVGSGSDIEYRISTFAPQANSVLIELCKYFGIETVDGDDAYSLEDISNLNDMKLASTYAVIAGVYATLADGGEESGFWKKSLYYQKLFEQARSRCRIKLTAMGSDHVEEVRHGSSMRLTRE
ncbi:MAG: hypothetical protein KAS23_05810 [Anaerohalosphaera sp.]|nr:hypothetical protein [Anaerohalosphaera sp.]